MTEAAHVREARARGEADAAKARLMETLDEVKARFAPKTLAGNAVQAAKDKSIVVADDAVAKVKERPGMAAGVATATALFIARKPLFSAVTGWFRRGRGDDDLTTETNGRRRRAATTEGQE